MCDHLKNDIISKFSYAREEGIFALQVSQILKPDDDKKHLKSVCIRFWRHLIDDAFIDYNAVLKIVDNVYDKDYSFEENLNSLIDELFNICMILRSCPEDLWKDIIYGGIKLIDNDFEHYCECCDYYRQGYY